jgi:hypothetical protein
MSAPHPIAIPDPRTFPEAAAAPPPAAALYRAAEASLAAETGVGADALDGEVQGRLGDMLAGDGQALAALIAGSPSVAVARHLWRLLDAAWREAASDGDAALAVTVFAVPLVIVAGVEAGHAERTLPAVLGAPEKLGQILREHRALRGNQNFALGNALVATDAFDVAALPQLLHWQRLSDAQAPGAALPARVLTPAPLVLAPGHEAVHLRFLVGSAIARPGTDLLADGRVGPWGLPLAQELSRQVGDGVATVLALPRAPQRPLAAAWQGRLAQREAAAQLFASNALRKLRGAVGEPAAIISAHRAADAAQGGELRLSLSSPFEPRDAEGFRCPLYPQDRVGDVAAMLADLLRDCRVADVRMLGGVHPDRDARTGMPVLYKPGTIPPPEAVRVH